MSLMKVFPLRNRHWCTTPAPREVVGLGCCAQVEPVVDLKACLLSPVKRDSAEKLRCPHRRSSNGDPTHLGCCRGT